jgi:hypothetical protein
MHRRPAVPRCDQRRRQGGQHQERLPEDRLRARGVLARRQAVELRGPRVRGGELRAPLGVVQRRHRASLGVSSTQVAAQAEHDDAHEAALLHPRQDDAERHAGPGRRDRNPRPSGSLIGADAGAVGRRTEWQRIRDGPAPRRGLDRRRCPDSRSRSTVPVDAARVHDAALVPTCASGLAIDVARALTAVPARGTRRRRYRRPNPALVGASVGRTSAVTLLHRRVVAHFNPTAQGPGGAMTPTKIGRKVMGRSDEVGSSARREHRAAASLDGCCSPSC